MNCKSGFKVRDSQASFMKLGKNSSTKSQTFNSRNNKKNSRQLKSQMNTYLKAFKVLKNSFLFSSQCVVENSSCSLFVTL